jgi:hypothetical protein
MPGHRTQIVMIVILEITFSASKASESEGQLGISSKSSSNSSIG